MAQFVSRAGQKLEHAIVTFGIEVQDRICADAGCSVGGFVDVLLRRGAARVYAIDTGWGVLDWRLRRDPRVVVMERTNAMHAVLPERVALLTIDVGWTRQKHILPAASRLLDDRGLVVTLIKPQYEADPAWLKRGVLPVERLDDVVRRVREDIESVGLDLIDMTRSPIKGSGGNVELLALLRRASRA